MENRKQQVLVEKWEPVHRQWKQCGSTSMGDSMVNPQRFQ